MNDTTPNSQHPVRSQQIHRIIRAVEKKNNFTFIESQADTRFSERKYVQHHHHRRRRRHCLNSQSQKFQHSTRKMRYENVSFSLNLCTFCRQLKEQHFQPQ